MDDGLAKLKREPDPDILQFCYARQVQWLKPLSEDIAHYKRAWFLLDDKSDFSFRYLFDAANRPSHEARGCYAGVITSESHGNYR